MNCRLFVVVMFLALLVAPTVCVSQRPVVSAAASASQAAAAHNMAESLERLANSSERPSDDTIARADLNAQDRMADAAEAMLWLSAMGILVSMGGVVLVIKTLGLNRAAVRQAELATTAANLALLHAQDTAQKQLRAYLSCTSTSCKVETTAIESYLKTKLDFKNAGQTEAHDVVVVLGFAECPFQQSEDFVEDAIKQLLRIPSGLIGPGVTFHHSNNLPRLKSEDGSLAFKQGLTKCLVYGAVEYKDAFDKPHRLEFRYRATQALLAGGLELCAKGNSST